MVIVKGYLERGKTIPNNKRLKIIAELSGSTVFELLYGSGYEYLMQNLPRLLYVIKMK